MDLEKQIKYLKEENSMQSLPEGVFGKDKSGDALPREPSKYTMQGHRGKVNKIVTHPFYNLVASASEDSSIRLWDFDQGEMERTLKSHTGIVNYVAFDPTGKMLASCSSDLTIKVWNLETFVVMKTL